LQLLAGLLLIHLRVVQRTLINRCVANGKVSVTASAPFQRLGGRFPRLHVIPMQEKRLVLLKKNILPVVPTTVAESVASVAHSSF
jgi:hypothetical protein